MIKAIINTIIAHNLTFLLIGTSTTSELSFPVYHAFSPQESMAKTKNVPGELVRMFFQRFRSKFLRTEYPPA